MRRHQPPVKPVLRQQGNVSGYRMGIHHSQPIRGSLTTPPDPQEAPACPPA